MRHTLRRRKTFSPARLGVSLALLVSLVPTAWAQDSFVRIEDVSSGQPAFSALGTGLGPSYVAMALDMACPDDGVWTMDLTGIRVPSGMRLDVGFGDPRGGFIPVPAIPLEFAQDRLRFTISRSVFARALAQAQAEYPGTEGSDLQILVGGIAGLSIGRDAMAVEMAAFLGDCEPARRTTTTARR